MQPKKVRRGPQKKIMQPKKIMKPECTGGNCDC